MSLTARDNYVTCFEPLGCKQKLFRENSGRLFKRAQTQLTSVFAIFPCALLSTQLAEVGSCLVTSMAKVLPWGF